MSKRPIPSSGQLLPVVGIGTWQTFDVSNNESSRQELKKVLTEMHRLGGKVIDSSPMYGSSEEVVGDLTSGLSFQDDLFYATKVWTSGEKEGIRQMEESMQLMQRPKMDLIQIHNLLDWQIHMKTLRKWKEEERVRYWGITHYTASAHERLSSIIKAEKPDFVQFNYSINDRNAERFLLDTAQEHGVAVIINRPFGGGELFRWARNRPLPDWFNEYQIHSWAQYFLKFILAHPAVTCVIPGTGKANHAIDNMGAGQQVHTGKEFQLKLLKVFQE